eukprot:7091706-Pyramimonas_sp.AAC.1
MARSIASGLARTGLGRSAHAYHHYLGGVPRGSPLQEHKRCFVALAKIVGICSQIGPSDAM